MVTSKQLENRFNERVSKELNVYTGKKGAYELKPKKDIYKIEKGYNGYRLVKQKKGGTGEQDISERYSAKEMEIYMKGLETGANIKTKKGYYS